MSAPASGSIVRVPGTLIWQPTDLTAAEPYGGTYLGQVRDIEFQAHPIVRPIWAEEFGAYTDAIYCGEKAVLKAVLRYPDADAIAQVAFKAGTSGGFLFRPGGTTGNTRAGTSLFSKAGKLLFAPRAKDTHQFLILYNAIPAFDETLNLRMALNEEYGQAIAFWGTPDSTGRTYDVELKANLTL